MNTPGRNNTNIQNYFVDIQRAPFNSLQLLSRYYIKPDSNPCWARHSLAMELKLVPSRAVPGTDMMTGFPESTPWGLWADPVEKRRSMQLRRSGISSSTRLSRAL
ncbi:hypothetical protein PENSUB_868 [Penicillium subrubescens]|uniref:Uncharacterized protein n=1 Tax=Penicillium subrubescens TaxID=1316194 RepID=A0A1Q5UMH2_9EURO|nr:hypothetical protein PENSUB_868 [Penicillium subrubescens]